MRKPRRRGGTITPSRVEQFCLPKMWKRLFYRKKGSGNGSNGNQAKIPKIKASILANQ